MYIWSAITRTLVGIVVLFCGLATESVPMKYFGGIILFTLCLDVVGWAIKWIVEEIE